jgi:hypothetical protein
VSVILPLLDALLTIAAGAAAVGLVTAPLRLLERALLSIVAGVVLSTAAAYGLALVAGVNSATVLCGPLLVVALALGLSTFADWPWRTWASAWHAAGAKRNGRALFALAAYGVAATVLFSVLFAHTLFTTNGALASGYANVWADWSQHLTTQASFAVAGHVPGENPLFSGTPLLYPFLADFHSATLVVLGMPPAAALAVPGAVLAIVIVLLVVCLAMRLRLGAGAGMVAAAVCFLGGGLGFVGVFADACATHGFTAAQCTFQHVVSNPGDGIHVIGGTLHDVPGVVAAQPRPYDGDLLPASAQPLPNMQWYTPLFAWWLPQRTIGYGFATALAVLLVVRVALDEHRRGWSAFMLAGVLLGLLPLVHVQTLLAVAVILAVLALIHRRGEWIALAAAGLALGLPRLVQLALAPHGSAADLNAYPWLEPGWLASGHANVGQTQTAVVAVLQTIAQPLSPHWWGFWFVNLGLAVPLCALVLIALAARAGPPRISAAAGHVIAWLPRQLLELFAGALVVFAACNLIVFQSWDWDNTKLFMYWYLVVGLIAGAIATYAWRRWWLRVVAVLLPVSMLLTGTIMVLRLLPWTPASYGALGPYIITSSDESALAETVAMHTAADAVFLTLGRPNDPLLTLSGRHALMGYYGWLWSYGIAFGSRPEDERVMYAGCSNAGRCDVTALLRQYHVDYVEVDDRVHDAGAISTDVNTAWWARAGFPVVARSEHIVVYDVRRAT